VVVKVREWTVVVGWEEEKKEKGEVVGVDALLCCEAVEAARVKGTPERIEVWNRRRKAEENSLKVARVSLLT
jgi:hypothetical protein